MHYLRLCFLVIVCAVLMPINKAHAAPDCAGDALISESFDNGARWEMCWESRIRENLVLSDVHYTPPDTDAVRVLSSARLSQLHVAYDDSDVTYNDVTQYGLGGGYLVELSAADCPQGELLLVQTRPAVCKTLTTEKDSYRTATRAVEAQSLTLFSVSQVGAYAYVITWKFYSDGAIVPEIGATGALQRSSSNTELPFGRVLEGDTENLWLSHTHNYYWRLDFDLGENGSDDAVTETRTIQSTEGQRVTSSTRFTTEQARKVVPEEATSWTIWDALNTDINEAQSFGYRIEPIRYGHRLVRETNEPYTGFDFFVTVANDCERFASQNARFNPDCLNHVLQYANGESLVDADLVLWHRVSFHHVPRNEDQRHMHAHWDGFTIEPVNVHANTPGIDQLTNQSPALADVEPQVLQVGQNHTLHLQASDADGDNLAFSADSLPPGMQLEADGHITGTPSSAGNYVTEVSVSDNIDSTSIVVNWQVNAAKESKGGFFGALHAGWLVVFLVIGASRIKTTTRIKKSGDYS